MDDVRKKIDEVLASDTFKWFVAFRSPKEIWENHQAYLILELSIYFLALLTFKHAWRSGGRFLYLWFATILHGLVVESLSYFVPDIDNFWHAQSMVMFVGKRLPLHIVVLYPVFIYTAAAAVSRLRLKSWAEPFAVGLAVVLLDIPFDIIGIKLLFWTWHDTDPNIFDRNYWVPWTSYYFHSAFASSFMILFFGTRHLLCSSPSKYEADGFLKEILCTIITGLLAMPVGILQFLPLYHPLHDIFNFHSEVCVLLFLSVYILIVWVADRHPTEEARSQSSKRGLFHWLDDLGLMVLLHFLLWIFLTMYGRPELIQSTGFHEKTGNCSAISAVQTASGKVLSRKTFLCTSDYDEGYYDFHCLRGGKPPADGLEWYTICGTPFPNALEYLIVVSAFSLFGLFVYVQMLGFSGKQPKSKASRQPQNPKNKRD